MGGTCPGQAALVLSIVTVDGYHAGCGVPRTWGGTGAAQPPPYRCCCVPDACTISLGGPKSSKNIPGGWRKASQARLFYPHPHQCLNPGGCFWGCLPPPHPRPASFPGCAENRAGGPRCEEAERCCVVVCPAAFRCPACSTLPLVSSRFCFPAADLFFYFHVAALSSPQSEAARVGFGADRASSLVLVFLILILVLLVQVLVAPPWMRRAGAACGVRPSCSPWKKG